MNYETEKSGVIELVSFEWGDKGQLNKILDEQNIAPDAIALRQKAKNLIEPIEDKDVAIKTLQDYL